MAYQSSIKYISSLLSSPATVTEGDYNTLAQFRQSYPYFVPVHYFDALKKHREQAFSPEMLTGIQPYMGDWIPLCDFMEGKEMKELHADAATAPQDIDNGQEDEVSPEAEDGAIENVVVEELILLTGEGEEITNNAVEEAQASEEVDINANEDINYEENIHNKEEVIPASIIQDAKEEPAYYEVIEETETVEKDIKEEPLILPVYTDDYFLHQGEKVSDEIPDQLPVTKTDKQQDEEDKSLMVVMSFSEWLMHFKHTADKQKEETAEQKALKSMWQKEKLAAAIEEENEEIPEEVFEMAVNSITKEDGLASESLADIYMKQGKYDKAIDMYRKLSLRNPQKNAYFAHKIEEVLKEKQS